MRAALHTHGAAPKAYTEGRKGEAEATAPGPRPTPAEGVSAPRLLVMNRPGWESEWDGMVEGYPDAGVFHLSSWAKAVSESYAYEPVPMVVHSGKNATALLPMIEVRSALTGKRGVSLPFTDYCAPLSEDSAAPAVLLEAVKGYAESRGWASIEFRGGVGADLPASASYYGHTLELDGDTEALFGRLDKNTQRNIRKAVREGVEVRVSESLEAVRAYYRLHCMTRKRHGIPPQPYSFFRNIHRHIIEGGHGFVVLGSLHGQDIAGAVYFLAGGKGLYKFGASDPRHQEHRANFLVMWEAIQNLARRSCRSLCFGRTDLHQDGLRRFKKSWGAVETSISYYTYDLKRRTWRARESHGPRKSEWFFRAMPIVLSRLLGSVLYRHVG